MSLNSYTTPKNNFLRYYLPPISLVESRDFLNELAISNRLDWYDEEKFEVTLEVLDDYYPFFSSYKVSRYRANLHQRCSWNSCLCSRTPFLLFSAIRSQGV